MYSYKGFGNGSGNGMSKSGGLVELLKLAQRNYRRHGMVGQIVRPDGTDLREYSRNRVSRPLANAEALGQ